MTVTSGTTFSVTALLPGNTYKFRISAVNAAGTGEPSNTASAIITTVPDSPVLTLTPGAAQIALSWSEKIILF
jgi:predicted phage tail protein